MLQYFLDDESVDQWYSAGFLKVPLEGAVENSAVEVMVGDTAEVGIYQLGKIVRSSYPTAFDVKPKNKEQHGAMKTLLDHSIPLKIITGREGTGKNHITAACVLEMLLNDKQNRYNKLVLTRTTDEVGRSLGLMPGSVDEKFGVHLNSFAYTMAAVVPQGADYISLLVEQDVISYMPIQFMRGVSFAPGTIVWADEIAGLSPFELRMLCTRLGKDCVLVLSGSLEQIDRRSTKEDTGLYKLIHSTRIQDSTLVSHIELVENERSALSTLISEVL